MNKPVDVGWRACYRGSIAHYWRKREDMQSAISLCWMVMPLEFLTDLTSGHHCAACEIMRARENGTECLKYLDKGEQNVSQDH